MLNQNLSSPQENPGSGQQPDQAVPEARGPTQILKSKISNYLNKRGCSSLRPIKAKLKAARKQRMRTVEFYICDNCDDNIISDIDRGFVIQGNIYTASPRHRGGLIGNNFPESNDGKVELSKIRETVLCSRCFAKALGLQVVKPIEPMFGRKKSDVPRRGDDNINHVPRRGGDNINHVSMSSVSESTTGPGPGSPPASETSPRIMTSGSIADGPFRSDYVGHSARRPSNAVSSGAIVSDLIISGSISTDAYFPGTDSSEVAQAQETQPHEALDEAHEDIVAALNDTEDDVPF